MVPRAKYKEIFFALTITLILLKFFWSIELNTKFNGSFKKSNDVDRQVRSLINPEKFYVL